ncbi:MAG: T9SS type A sorting domain-containing protein [Ignavibacteriales bacterium]|nr:T9SS type A sorting domain-containing protein [Ignavibacteriales bacterium]
MKYVVTVAAALVIFISTANADVFASRFKVTNPDGSAFDGSFTDGTAAKIWYMLNDTATAVAVKVINASNGSVVATINATNQGRSMNPNSVTWDGTGTSPGGKYYITVTTTGPVYSDTKFYPFYFQNTADVPPLVARGIYTRGVDINNNMNLPGFGYWYASNSDPGNNDGYKQGTLRYNPDGTFEGTEPNHPLLTQTLSTGNGGTYDWGAAPTPWTALVDDKGRIYQVSNGGGFVTRMDNDSALPKIIIRNIKNPRGMYMVGEGAARKLYIAADTVVWRANIGNDDTLMTPLELVGAFGLYARDVVIDDAGGMTVTLRTGELTHPGFIERYDISGGLPKKRSDATFSIESTLGLPVCFEIKRGTDLNSASDDTLYFAVRRSTGSDTTTFGIHQLTNIDGFFPEVKQVYKNSDHPSSAGGNNRQDADIALDWAGNIIWFENGNEEIVMIAVPRTGSSVTLTTKSADTITVSGSVGNYPNPFNPTTTISYQLPKDAHATVVVYDLLGNIVKELFSGAASGGYNAVVWNATNNAGTKVSSGMYLYRVTAQLSDGRTFTDVKRMLMLK